ncbi:hypothetical protein ABXN37_10095 [Piscinibacter sakaiensis]|uniref:hypothetical protein n=1 Tax=Piscinibacter sakaiensis TaxID=1547922 RepID=UPI00372932CC
MIPAMSRKWKQINKFVEVLDAGWRDSALAQRPAGAAPLRVMDFGGRATSAGMPPARST